MEKRRKYGSEFKEVTVQLTKEGERSMTQVVRNLGNNAAILGQWCHGSQRRSAQAFPGTGNSTPKSRLS